MKKFLLLFLILIPSFFRLIRPGLYSMQDFPYFRVVEYNHCLDDQQFPCRWAADAGLGYGEPVFNFYSHVPFLTGAALINLGFSAITSLKILFAASIVFSGLGMYLLSKRIWKNDYSAMLSAVLYVYAPYRAVNVWVRGALPESFAFIFIPFILLSFENYVETKKVKWLCAFSLLLSLLILTHNLSVVLFAPVILVFIVVRFIQSRRFSLFLPLLIAGIFAICLASFYILPALVEAPLVNLQTTTTGYFDFRAHFVTVPQLFLSRFWGYGGSTWGDQDGLSLSIGQMQWIVSLSVLVITVFYLCKRKIDQKAILALFLLLVAALALLLTHNKSAFLWEYGSSFMKYIQFPWRFLGLALFCMSLASGYISALKSKYLTVGVTFVILVTIALNLGFFKEDIWRNVNDQELQTGTLWIEQTRASIGDYWPQYGPIPVNPAQSTASIKPLLHASNKMKYEVLSDISTQISLPVTYYPGWTARINNNLTNVSYDTSGLISVPVQKGATLVELTLESTPIQHIGNSISAVSVLLLLLFLGIRIIRNQA